MTVRRGEDWGSTGALATGAPVVESDRGLASLCRTDGPMPAEVGLTGGDLARTVGARGSPDEIRSGTDRPRLPIDIGIVTVDGTAYPFVAHVVVRRRWWRGRVVVVANAAFLGAWNVAPRSHPNDGRLEVIDAQLRIGDRLKARRRLLSGSHVPHPDISARSVRELELDIPSGAHVHVDGVDRGPGERLFVEVHPDALTIVI